MVETFSVVMPYLVLASHGLFLLLLLAVVFRSSWGGGVTRFLGKYAVWLAGLVALGALVGSLFYSEIVGFEACVLCWWQRAFLYPIVPIMAVALWRGKQKGGDRSVFEYVVPLAILAGVVGAYQAFANFSGKSFLECTAAEGACSKIYVMAFGYITIPTMSLTVVAYILLLAWVNKLYVKDSNSRQ